MNACGVTTKLQMAVKKVYEAGNLAVDFSGQLGLAKGNLDEEKDEEGFAPGADDEEEERKDAAVQKVINSSKGKGNGRGKGKGKGASKGLIVDQTAMNEAVYAALARLTPAAMPSVAAPAVPLPPGGVAANPLPPLVAAGSSVKGKRKFVVAHVDDSKGKGKQDKKKPKITKSALDAGILSSCRWVDGATGEVMMEKDGVKIKVGAEVGSSSSSSSGMEAAVGSSSSSSSGMEGASALPLAKGEVGAVEDIEMAEVCASRKQCNAWQC